MAPETAAKVPLAERNIPGRDDFLSAEEVKALSPEIVIERVRELKPFIAERRRASEQRGMPLDEVWNAIRRTGYFYLMVPKVWGGLEATYDQMLDATFAICEADPSVGWLCSFSVMNPRSAAAFSEEALKDMYGGNRYTILNTLFAPFGEAKRVEGGYRVSGTWFWGTTVQMADWVSVMAHYDKPDGTKALGTFLFSADQADVLDTWTANGLIATGTHRVRAQDVFVPDYRTVPFIMTSPEWIEHIRSRFDYPIFRADLRNALSTTIAVPLVGIARGALMRYKELLATWVKRGEAASEAENQSSQIRLSHVNAIIQSCEIQLRDIAHRTYAIANEPADVQVVFAEKVRGEISFVAHRARDAVLEISKGLGTSTHYLEEPMNQYIRDIVVGSSHVAVNWDTNMTASGRALLGIAPPGPAANVRMA